MKLINKISLITGAAQGIGEAIAKKFSNEGAVVILCDIKHEKLEEVAKKINANGKGKAFSLKVDVSKPEEVIKLFEYVKNKFNRIDILVNNAGISPKQKFEDISPEDWDKVLSVNLKSMFLCTKEALKMMKKMGSGKIINMSSMAGQNGGTTASPHYVASKAGVIGFTKAMAKLIGPDNININTIAPGRILTELYHKNISLKLNKEIMKRIPLGYPGKPKDVAEGVLFLATESSKYITGACLNINGGICLTS